nr:MAG: protein m37 [Herpesviridae sp.]
MMSTVDADHLNCSYNVCVSRREEKFTSVGCIVRCSYNDVAVLSGDCAAVFKLMVRWTATTAIERNIVTLMKVGLAYYFGGYLARAVSGKIGRKIYPHVVSEPLLFGGSVRCWTRVNETEFGGDAVLDVGPMGSYSFKTCFSGENETCGWISKKEKENVVPDLIGHEGSTDDEFFRLCPRIVRLFVDKTHRAFEGSSHRIRSPCSGGFSSSTWEDMWVNWTKYSELKDNRFLDPTFARMNVSTQTSKQKQSKMIGMFVVVLGAFMLLLMICVLSLMRRNEIIKDLRGESSLRFRGELFLDQNKT